MITINIYRKFLSVLIKIFLLIFSISPIIDAEDKTDKIGVSASKQWNTVPGLATDITSSSTGQVFVISDKKQPWRWDRTQGRWRSYSGQFERIVAAEENFPWALNASGELFRFNGLWWEIKHEGVIDVTANASGQVYIINQKGNIEYWYALRNEWQVIKGQATKINVDNNGTLWATDNNAQLKSFDGKGWKIHTQQTIRDFVISDKGHPVIVSTDGRILRFSNQNQSDQWDTISDIANVKAIAMAKDNAFWVILSDGSIATNDAFHKENTRDESPNAKLPRAKTLLSKKPNIREIQLKIPKPVEPVAEQAEARPISAIGQTPKDLNNNNTGNAKTGDKQAVDPATLSSKDPIKFFNTFNIASTIAIGGDGSVFGLRAGGQIVRWSNKDYRFNDFPGALTRIAVAPNGNPWGISSLGRVFRHTGRRWEQIPNTTASDITIGYNHRVVIANAEGRLFEFDRQTAHFKPVFGANVLLLASAPDGRLWSIRTDRLVQQCDDDSCKIYSQKARSIAIGPDNSVYIVSDSQQLFVLDRSKDKFTLFPIKEFSAVEQVAVGPMGLPWIIDGENRVFASSLFERDESQDRLMAMTTPSNGTTGTGLSAEVVSTEASQITFTKNMRFQNIPNTVAIGTGDFNILEVGNDGSIWASVVSAMATSLEQYNETRNRFEAVANTHLTNTLDIILGFDVASNQDFWVVTGANLYRLRGSQLKDFTFIPGAYYEDISIGGDDSIYVLIDNRIYILASGENTFKPFSKDINISRISAGRAGELWVIDANEVVKQWDGQQFDNRPKGRTQLASTVKAGKGGAVYITSAILPLQPLKWNATNNSFDSVNNANLDFGAEIAVEANGRLWVLTPADNTIKRERN